MSRCSGSLATSDLASSAGSRSRSSGSSGFTSGTTTGGLGPPADPYPSCRSWTASWPPWTLMRPGMCFAAQAGCRSPCHGPGAMGQEDSPGEGILEHLHKVPACSPSLASPGSSDSLRQLPPAMTTLAMANHPQGQGRNGPCTCHLQLINMEATAWGAMYCTTPPWDTLTNWIYSQQQGPMSSHWELLPQPLGKPHKRRRPGGRGARAPPAGVGGPPSPLHHTQLSYPPSTRVSTPQHAEIGGSLGLYWAPHGIPARQRPITCGETHKWQQQSPPKLQGSDTHSVGRDTPSSQCMMWESTGLPGIPSKLRAPHQVLICAQGTIMISGRS